MFIQNNILYFKHSEIALMQKVFCQSLHLYYFDVFELNTNPDFLIIPLYQFDDTMIEQIKNRIETRIDTVDFLEKCLNIA